MGYKILKIIIEVKKHNDILRFDNLRPLIVEKLLESFSMIRSVKIHRATLWILGEYCIRVKI